MEFLLSVNDQGMQAPADAISAIDENGCISRQQFVERSAKGGRLERSRFRGVVVGRGKWRIGLFDPGDLGLSLCNHRRGSRPGWRLIPKSPDEGSGLRDDSVGYGEAASNHRLIDIDLDEWAIRHQHRVPSVGCKLAERGADDEQGVMGRSAILVDHPILRPLATSKPVGAKRQLVRFGKDALAIRGRHDRNLPPLRQGPKRVGRVRIPNRVSAAAADQDQWTHGGRHHLEHSPDGVDRCTAWQRTIVGGTGRGRGATI